MARHALVLMFAVCAAARAGGTDFNAIVKGVESQYGTSRLRIPLLGPALVAARFAQPHGVRSVDLAIFENFRAGAAGAAQFDRVVRKAVGSRWQPMIVVRSAGEATHIYARSDGKHMEFIVASFEPDEAVLVEAKVDAEAIASLIDEPASMAGKLGVHAGREAARAARPLRPSPEPAAQVMARVADNQDRAEKLRASYIYDQNVLIRLHRGNHRLAREEIREYVVAPTPNGTEKKMARFAGKYESHGRYIEYDKPHYTYKDVDIDGELASDLAEEFTSDKKSRDGVAADLFPLTAGKQQRYTFQMQGIETYRGRDVYRVTFDPKKQWTEDDGEPWAGEALIDVSEHQPVLVTTHLAKGLPFWVKTFLGTNIKQIGFKVAYKRFDDGIWFPVSYGGEFELRAVFVYKRIISLSMTNRDFRRSDVTTAVKYENIR